MKNCVRPDVIPGVLEPEDADFEEGEGLLELLAFALTVEEASCKFPGISMASIP